MTDKIFLSFWTVFCLFTLQTTQKITISKNWKKTPWRYYHLTYVYHKWWSYDVWFLRYEAWRTEFFVILDRFLHFYPPNNLKNQNFKEMKKAGDIIILQKCTKNYDHMVYCSWDMTRDRYNCYLFCVIFSPLIPQPPPLLSPHCKVINNNSWTLYKNVPWSKVSIFKLHFK